MPNDTMLVIRSRAKGAGIFDVIAKAANSALAKKVITSAVNKAANSNLAKKVVKSGIAKKVINSTVGKTIAENVTKENFKKAANSAFGKQLQKAVVTGVDNAIERATTAGLQKLGFPATAPSNVESLIPTGSKRPYQSKKKKLIPTGSKRPYQSENKKLIPPGSKRPLTGVGRIKGKRRKIGKGIILE